MMPPPPPPSPPLTLKKQSSSSSSSCCRHSHSPSATLDLLIFILVLFSCSFLIISYFSYIFQSISLLPFHSQLIFTTTLFFFFFFFFLFFCFGYRSRRCGKKGCRGLKKAMEFDLQLQGEELLKMGDMSKAVRDVNNLPWKGGTEDNTDYECLRAELRKMAPLNGRAVLLFRAKCGCPHSKLEGWGTKRGRRNKKSLAISGGGDHRR